MSLKRLWKEEITPLLKNLVGPTGKFSGYTIIFQEDGAGPHQNSQYLNYMNTLFEKENWILLPQPPQSPCTNRLDLYVFPMLSKRVSKNWRQYHPSGHTHIMSTTEINAAVVEEWEKMKEVEIAKAAQVQYTVNKKIIECKGGNNFTYKKGALHSSVRSSNDVSGSKLKMKVELLETLHELP